MVEILLFLTLSGANFDVASVKPAGPFVPNQPTRRGGPGTSDPGRITFNRVTLGNLIGTAYEVLPDQISGPAWISDYGGNLYDVTATMPPDTTKEQFREMLQNLLAERFHLRLHHQEQLRPGYELTVAEGGPKLKAWVPPAEPDLRRSQGVSFVFSPTPHAAPLHFNYRDTMARFAVSLGANINAAAGIPIGGGPLPRVVDRTGLTGLYEFTLEFTGVVFSPAALAMSPPADTASEPSGAPNLFTAVEKQLGLKLKKAKDVPVDVLVIDAGDKVPVAN